LKGFQKMKALVVDDDSISRLVLEDSLSRFGQVDGCADGAEAARVGRLALASGNPYDLICLDIMMPIMSGLEALHAIRQEEERHGRPRAAKVIVITGREDPASIHEAFGQFCDAYLVKPIDVAGFLDVVECLCPLAASEPARSQPLGSQPGGRDPARNRPPGSQPGAGQP
jgi:two-component system, chemotaxis family, chemotaxis protein CheY